MAGRYLITGVQLGMLVDMKSRKDREVLAKEIEDKQYVGFSNGTIEQDAKIIAKIAAPLYLLLLFY